MTCVSVGKPVVVGQATGTAWGKPDDLARYSAALDPGDGGAVTGQTTAGPDKTKTTLMVTGGLYFSFKQI